VKFLNGCFVILFGLFASACSEALVPNGPVNPTTDAGEASQQLCRQDEDCPSGQLCRAGICQENTPDSGIVNYDAAVEPKPGIAVCTLSGCDAPYKVDFGGSRLGLSTVRTLTIKSVGEQPLTVRSIDLLNEDTEFSVEPSGQLELTLQPGEEVAVRVAHQAIDGIADSEELQIISDAPNARVLVSLTTEYKGIPSLAVNEEAQSNGEPITVLDFGNVRVGELSRKKIFIKNRDSVMDGSILRITELRVDPQSSTNFSVQLDRPLPASLNQFSSLCMSDSNCNQASGQVCATDLGVCRLSTGELVDIATATVSFMGNSPGLIQENLLLVSNDGAASNESTHSVLLRANVIFSQLEINPDPITYTNTFVGYTYRETVTLTNMGTGSVKVGNIQLMTSAPFTLDFGSMGSPPWTIDTNQSYAFEVVYTPQMESTDLGTVIISSDDSSNPRSSIQVSATALLPPEVEISEHYADFNDVHQGDTETITVIVENRGGSELRIPSITLSSSTASAFSVDPTSLGPIPPSSDQLLNIRYNPVGTSYPNNEGGVVVLQTNDPLNPTLEIGLSGRAINPEARMFPTPPFNFNIAATNPNNPEVFVGQFVDISTTVSNPGVGPLVISNIEILGDIRGSFQLVNLPSLPFVVMPNQGQTIELRYRPLSAGNDVGELKIFTNDTDVGTQAGQLLGALAGSAIGCPAKPNMTASANAAGTCEYQCNTHWYDLDQNDTNGCEYNCVFISNGDQPDDSFQDANCDGIDGVASEAVFVAPAPIGNDANAGTIGAPMATIANAIQQTNSTRAAVYLSQGTYNGSVTLTDGVSLFGGYDATDNWSRAANHTTTLIGQSGLAAMTASGINQSTIVDRFTVVAGDGNGNGGNSTAIYVFDSGANLEIRNSIIIGGDGARGNDGSSGSIGASGGNASSGGNGCDGCSGNGSRGAGGSSSCGAQGGAGGYGGYDNGSGTSGFSGAGGSRAGSAGSGGGGAAVCNSSLCSGCAGRKNGQNGTSGSNGSSGATGQAGSRGNGAGNVSQNRWLGSRGSTGGAGTAGGGGGGGGAGGGGADDCYINIFACISDGNPCNRDRGGGGGGGGAGGCGGTGGTGGYGGGGSFGIFLRNSSATLVNNSITAGNGGNGGNGGLGGTGGTPGAGAAGGGKADGSGAGAQGGDGGNGGRGGRGGGGGGGVSYGIYRSNSNAAILTNNLYVTGSGGAGGTGGQNGSTGNSGTVF